MSSDEINLLRDLIKYMQDEIQQEIGFIRHDMLKIQKDVDVLNKWKWKLSGITLALVTAIQGFCYFYEKPGGINAIDQITHQRSKREEHPRNDRSGPRSETSGRGELRKSA